MSVSPSSAAHYFNCRPLTVKIHDARVKAIYNVAAYGAVAGDNEANATANKTAFQNAVNAAATGLNQQTEQAIVYVPAGTYVVGPVVSWAAGVSLVGADQATTIIKAPSETWLLANGWEGNIDAGGRWQVRSFGIGYTNATTSSLTALRNITFDGNRANRAEVSDTLDNQVCPVCGHTLIKHGCHWEPSPIWDIGAGARAI